MKTIVLGTAALAIICVTQARADICTDYRAAIDHYAAEADAIEALEDTRESALKAARAARAVRKALRSLDTDTGAAVLEAADASELLASATEVTAATIDTFEAIYKVVKPTIVELLDVRAADLEAARLEADIAAEGALDSLGTFKAMTKRRALKTASTAAEKAALTVAGGSASAALLSAHENIYADACE